MTTSMLFSRHFGTGKASRFDKDDRAIVGESFASNPSRRVNGGFPC